MTIYKGRTCCRGKLLQLTKRKYIARLFISFTLAVCIYYVYQSQTHVEANKVHMETMSEVFANGQQLEHVYRHNITANAQQDANSTDVMNDTLLDNTRSRYQLNLLNDTDRLRSNYRNINDSVTMLRDRKRRLRGNTKALEPGGLYNTTQHSTDMFYPKSIENTRPLNQLVKVMKESQSSQKNNSISSKTVSINDIVPGVIYSSTRLNFITNQRYKKLSPRENVTRSNEYTGKQGDPLLMNTNNTNKGFNNRNIPHSATFKVQSKKDAAVLPKGIGHNNNGFHSKPSSSQLNNHERQNKIDHSRSNQSYVIQAKVNSKNDGSWSLSNIGRVNGQNRTFTPRNFSLYNHTANFTTYNTLNKTWSKMHKHRKSNVRWRKNLFAETKKTNVFLEHPNKSTKSWRMQPESSINTDKSVTIPYNISKQRKEHGNATKGRTDAETTRHQNITNEIHAFQSAISTLPMATSKPNQSTNYDIPLNVTTSIRDKTSSAYTSHATDTTPASPTSTPPPLCPWTPPDLLGVLSIDKTQYEEKTLERSLSSVTNGGCYKPPMCTSRHRVAIIIPYRDRREHLMVLLNNLHPVLQRHQLDYRIFVVELGPLVQFNRGLSMNIGFAEALKLDDYKCFIFHDVDLIPENDNNFYTCADVPRHLSVSVNTFNYKLPYLFIFGGVVAIPKEQFQLINGFSNKYFGWGGEDDDLYQRIRNQGIPITRFTPDVARYLMLVHVKDTPGAYRFTNLRHGLDRWKTDGLNSLTYQAITREKKLYTYILADLDQSDATYLPDAGSVKVNNLALSGILNKNAIRLDLKKLKPDELTRNTKNISPPMPSGKVQLISLAVLIAVIIVYK